MRKLWVLVLGLAVALGTGWAADEEGQAKPAEGQAQGGQGQAKEGDQAGGKAERRAKGPLAPVIELMGKLDLTDEQQAKMKPVLQDAGKQARALRQDEQLDKRQKAQKLRELIRATTRRLEELLTPEQKQKLKQLRAEEREKAGKGDRGEKAGQGDEGGAKPEEGARDQKPAEGHAEG